MKNKILIILGTLLIVSPAYATKRLHREVTYQTSWCNKIGGKKEYVLNDKCRVDCLTKTHAIEFDFANKWAESVGQSQYYGIMTKRKAGVVLIVEDPKRDKKYIRRLKKVALKKGIDYWLMYPADL